MKPHSAVPRERHCYAAAKAYRVKGGAIVTITRSDGTARRHKVSSLRFRWLKAVFGLAASCGSFSSSGFDCKLAEPIQPQVEWLKSQRRSVW